MAISLTPANFVMPIGMAFILYSALSAVVLFGCVALGAYYFAVKTGKFQFTTDFFLSARGTQPWYRVAWGFYACSIGASVIFSVASFVTNPIYGGGWVGLIMYSLFSGIPLVLVAYLGTIIKEKFPQALSIGSFARWRFGKSFQAWVTFNVLLNLGIALAAEFTAIGAIYSSFLGQPAYIPIVVVAIVTMVYTAAGGLYVSLFTDYVQSGFIFLLLGIMAIFVGVNFRVTLPPGPLPSYLDVNEVGLASIMTLGVALTSSTLFSDAVWQRVWCAKDNKSLMIGASVGGALTTLVSFLFGGGAFVAAWAGLVTDPNTAFLELLKVGNSTAIPIGMLLVVVLIASVMNEAAIDSYQIAIGDTLFSLFESFNIHMPLWGVRVLLVLLNIPFAVIGCQNFPIINLYLITNLLTTCVMCPLLFGLIPQLDFIVNGFTALFGSLFGLSALVIYAVWNQVVVNGTPFKGSDIGLGLYNTFYVVYDWPSFTIGLVGSIVGCALYAGVEEMYYRAYGIDRPIPTHLLESPYDFEKIKNVESSKTLAEDRASSSIVAL